MRWSILSGTYIAMPNNLEELGLNAEDIMTDLQGADRE